MRWKDEHPEPRDRLTHDFGELCEHGWPIDNGEGCGLPGCES